MFHRMYRKNDRNNLSIFDLSHRMLSIYQNLHDKIKCIRFSYSNTCKSSDVWFFCVKIITSFSINQYCVDVFLTNIWLLRLFFLYIRWNILKSMLISFRHDFYELLHFTCTLLSVFTSVHVRLNIFFVIWITFPSGLTCRPVIWRNSKVPI